MPPAKSGGAKAPNGRKAANGYRLPDPLPEGEIIRAVHAKKAWRLGKSIGVGGFGEIYLCSTDLDRRVGEDAPLAVKIEPHQNGPLFVEMNFYIRAAQPESVEAFKRAHKDRGNLGMPVLRGSGSHVHAGEKYRFLVMDRYGKDLQKIFARDKVFSLRTAFNLAIKIVDVLEYIHSQGYVHNDIKAQNLLLGYGRTHENDIYLVDFGLVSKYLRDGVHLEYKPDARKAHDGTIEYTSRDAHIGAHSRRSDLEILAYNLVHWISGTLPWMDNLTNPKYVQTQKNGFMSDIPVFLSRCFGGSDYPAELEAFLLYVASLDFDTEPDYDKCRDFFIAGLRKRRFPLDGKIDFTQSPAKKVRKSSTNDSTKTTSPKRKVKAVPTVKADKKKAVPAVKTDKKKAVTPKAKKSPVKKTKTSSRRKSCRATNTVSEEEMDDEETTIDEVESDLDEAMPEMKNAGCQTSPAFVKMAKEAARKRKRAMQNPEMSDFIKEAKEAARKANGASAASPRTKSSKGKSPADSGLSNPTAAMLALMKKREEDESAKKEKRRRRK